MHENDLFDMFSEFSYLVHIPAVMPATSRSAQRSFIALRRLKTYLRSTWSNNVSVTVHLLIYIERAYANSVVIDLINDIFHRQNGRS